MSRTTTEQVIKSPAEIAASFNAEQARSDAVCHGIADIEPGLRLHFITAGQGPRTMVLLHGFPQTWREWRLVIPALTKRGFRVVAPDYRGAGQSWRPPAGYDKQTMAEDIHKLLTTHLGIDDPVVMVGHDIGLMVAYAYAQAHPGRVSHLVVADASLPGTAVFDRLRTDPGTGTSRSTAHLMCLRCWSQDESASTCKFSSTTVPPTPRRSATPTWTPTHPRTRLQARCEPASRCTGPSARTLTTTRRR
jgi:pimeloyl-ACP methyl ester carboxylesterase